MDQSYRIGQLSHNLSTTCHPVFWVKHQNCEKAEMAIARASKGDANPKMPICKPARRPRRQGEARRADLFVLGEIKIKIDPER